MWIVGAVVIIWIAKSMFAGGGEKKPTTKNNTNTPEITLLNENTNAAANTNAANVNSDINANANTNAAASVTDASILKKCPTAISQYGEQKNVVLTFDIAGGGDAAVKAVDALKAAKVPASFFASGKFADKNADLLAQLAKDGFPVYNRTYDNSSLAALSAAAVTEEITKAELSISAATKASSKPFLRPPLGDVSATVTAAAKDAGYCLITWTVDAFDWQADITADASAQRVLDKLRPGAIIALHLGYDVTPSVLTALIPKITSAGYTIVALSALLGT